MTNQKCNYCPKVLNGLTQRMEHQLTHEEFRKKARDYFDRQIAFLQKKERQKAVNQ